MTSLDGSQMTVYYTNKQSKGLIASRPIEEAFELDLKQRNIGQEGKKTESGDLPEFLKLCLDGAMLGNKYKK